MILTALILLATGIAVSLLGFKMFRILLPLLGLVAGAEIGFIGFQGIFGTGAVSTTVAIFVAIAVGLVMALLSFLFFEIAVTIYVAILGASLLTYLGVALGLGGNGFVLLLLAIGGVAIGLSITRNRLFSANLIIAVTSFIGVALVLSSIFLIAGHVSADQLNSQGVVSTIVRVIDQSFLWTFVWLSGSLIAMQAQRGLLAVEILENQYQYEAAKKKLK